jgi:hypothetical protein
MPSCSGSEIMVAVILVALLAVATATSTPVEEGLPDTFVALSVICPPGFVSQGNSCVCADWPNEIISCDENLQRASMQIGYCMTYINETGEVRVGGCSQTFFRTDSDRFYFPLPSNASDLNEEVCGPLDRKGLLCSECRDDLVAVVVGLGLIRCVECKGYVKGWLTSIATQFLPTTIILVVIVVLSVGVVSGPTNAFIFFSQVTTTFVDVALAELVLQAQGSVNYSYKPVLAISSLYDIWNLSFFKHLVPAFCRTKTLSLLQEVALQYAIALYPLFLVIVLYVCIELHDHDFRPLVWCWKPFHKCFVYCRRSISPNTSVIDAFATFTLLSYVKLLNITDNFLLYRYVYNGQGERVSTVVSFDSNIEYLDANHLPYALTAIFVVLTFITIPPIVLLMYQCSAFQRCLARCRMNTLAFRTFVDIFQGPYKCGLNGTLDCRYFAGLYFILRIIVFFLSFGGTFIYIVGSSVLYFFTALLFAILQPYRKHFHNVVDAVIFAFMATMYMFIAIQAASVFLNGQPYTFLLILTDVLYTLPLVYLTVFVIFWLLDRRTGCVQKLKQYRILSCFSVGNRQFETQGIEIMPHRLLYPADYTNNGNSGAKV